MSWIEIVWPMMAASSLTVGGIHLLIWLRQRDQPAHLMLSAAATAVSVCGILELLTMRASTPEHYAGLLRWANVSVALLIIAVVGFVLLHFRASRAWLGLTVCALRAACVPVTFLSGANLNFETITALDKITLWDGDVIAVPVGEANPWMLLGQVSNLLLVLFLIDTIVATWRRAGEDERRRALIVCGSIALFVLLASGWAAAVVMGWVVGPMTINVAFLIVIMAMAHEIGGDVLRAARLNRQLIASELRHRESEQRMQLASNAAGVGLWSWDLQSEHAWFTESGTAMLGLAQGKPMTLDILLAQIHPDDQEAMLRARDEAIHGTGDYLCEFRLPQPSGHMRWVAAKGRVEYATSGEARLVRGVLQDVTEQREADARFQQVIEGAPTAMLIIDSDACITLANAEAERVFGYTRSEMLGQRIEQLLPDTLLAGRIGNRSHFGKNRRTPSSKRRAGEPFGLRSDGSKMRVELRFAQLHIGGQMFTLATVTDISERLRLEQETALQRDELAHLSRVTLLGEMSGSLAHELNQPLTAVLSNAQAALRFMDHQPPNLDEIRDCLVHIVDNDKRASEVIRRLRAMLRKDPVDYQKLSINDVVEDVLRLIHSDLLNRSVVVTLDLAPDLPVIDGDRVQLQQVLLNLIINACDAMEDLGDGRMLEVETHLESGPTLGVHLSISDVGRGVPADDLERIFIPFVTSKVEGIGLGLPICRTLIQAHRGKLWATNNTATGATLHVVLPA